MKNAIIIPSAKDHIQNNWPSLQMIGQSLEETYDSFLKDKVKIKAPFSGASQDSQEFIQTVGRLPDHSHLIFPYAIPKQVRLIKPLLTLIKNKSLKCRVHLYGDFFQQWPDWKDLLGKVPDENFNLAALSERFSQVIANTLSSPKNIQVLIPSLNLTSWAFDRSLRGKVRSKMNLQNDELLILTVSRINECKGFFRNYEVVKNLSKNHKVRWVLAGDFDDWNLPYAGEVFPAGYTFSSIIRFLSSQKSNFQIEFLGHIESAEVKDLSHAADLFLHLSRSFEEDFSLAAREAIANGLPCVLEDWGPFVDLASYDNVLLGARGLENLLHVSLEDREKFSRDAIHKMRSIDQKRFLDFLSSSMSFESTKINHLNLEQFKHAMEGRHE